MEGAVESPGSDRHEPVHVLQEIEVGKQRVFGTDRLAQMAEGGAFVRVTPIEAIQTPLEFAPQVSIRAGVQQEAVLAAGVIPTAWPADQIVGQAPAVCYLNSVDRTFQDRTGTDLRFRPDVRDEDAEGMVSQPGLVALPIGPPLPRRSW